MKILKSLAPTTVLLFFAHIVFAETPIMLPLKTVDIPSPRVAIPEKVAMPVQKDEVMRDREKEIPIVTPEAHENYLRFMGARPVEIPGIRRVEAPLNERLQLKYSRQLQVQRKFQKIVRYFIRQSSEFDDNVSGNRSDLIYRTRAGFNLNLLRVTGPRFAEMFTQGGLNFGLTYLVDYQSVPRGRNGDKFRQVLSPNISLPHLELPPFASIFGRRARISVREDLHPEQFATDLFSDSDRGFRITNSFGASIAYPLTEKTVVSVPYSNQINYYLDSDFSRFNSMTQSLTPTVTFHATPKTTLFGSARFSMSSFRERNNFRDFILRAGISKEITAKVRVGFTGGYQVRMRESAVNNLQSWIFNLFYHHNITKNTNFSLSMAHGISDFFSGGTTLGTARGLDEAVSAENPSVTRTTLNARINHALSPKVSLNGGLQVVYENEENPGRNDTLYRLDGGVSYRIREGLRLNLRYFRTSRHSEGTGVNSGSDRDNNRLILSVDYSHGGGEALVKIERAGKAYLDA